jgi:hypothetical protein
MVNIYILTEFIYLQRVVVGDLDPLHFKVNGEEPVLEFSRILWSFHIYIYILTEFIYLQRVVVGDLDPLHFKVNGEEPVLEFSRILWSFHI